MGEFETHIELEMPLNKQYLTQRNLKHTFRISTKDANTGQATAVQQETKSLYDMLVTHFDWLKLTHGLELNHLLEAKTFKEVTRNWALAEVKSTLDEIRMRDDLSEGTTEYEMVWLYINQLFSHPEDRYTLPN
jgi:hypothetical protein